MKVKNINLIFLMYIKVRIILDIPKIDLFKTKSESTSSDPFREIKSPFSFSSSQVFLNTL